MDPGRFIFQGPPSPRLARFSSPDFQSQIPNIFFLFRVAQRKQNCFVSPAMYPQHIITGKPAAFTKAVNQLVASRDVSMSIRGITFHGGELAAVIDESSLAQGAAGSIIRLSAEVVKDPQKHADALIAENPMWKIDAVFSIGTDPVGPSTRAKSSVIVVATCRQP